MAKFDTGDHTFPSLSFRAPTMRQKCLRPGGVTLRVTSVCFADSDPNGPIPPTVDAVAHRQTFQEIVPLAWEGDVEGDVAPSLSHLGCSPSSREPLPAEHRARHRGDSNGRTRNMMPIGQHVVTRKWRLR